MSIWVIFNPDTLQIYNTSYSSGSAKIFYNWYLARATSVPNVKVEEIESDGVDAWLMWKTLTK